MNRLLRYAAYLMLLLVCINFSCNKDDNEDDEPIVVDFTAIADATNITVAPSTIAVTEIDTINLTIATDYPNSFDENLGDDWLVDQLLTSSTVLPDEVVFMVNGQTFNADGTNAIWISEITGANRSPLKDANDSNQTIRIINLPIGEYTFTASAVTAKTANFNTQNNSHELGAVTSSVTVVEYVEPIDLEGIINSTLAEVVLESPGTLLLEEQVPLVIDISIDYPATYDENLNEDLLVDLLVTSTIPLPEDIIVEVLYNGEFMGTTTALSGVESFWVSEITDIGRGVLINQVDALWQLQLYGAIGITTTFDISLFAASEGLFEATSATYEVATSSTLVEYTEPLDIETVITNTLAEINIENPSFILFEQQDTLVIDLLVDYPATYDENLSEDLLVDLLVSVNLPLPDGISLDVLYNGETINTGIDISGAEDFWLSEIIGIERASLISKTDANWQLRLYGFQVVGAAYSFGINQFAASADGFNATGATYASATSNTPTSILENTYKMMQVETDFGNILIWLYDQTPGHKSNYIGLIEDAFFDGISFHRVIDNFVIQGGDPTGTGEGGAGYEIDAEIVPGLDHVWGAVGAAREGDDVNPEMQSSSSQFYIVENPNGEAFLNGNYTVFGIVVGTMDAVTAIASVPVDDDDKPIDDVLMNQVVIVRYSDFELLNLFGFVRP